MKEDEKRDVESLLGSVRLGPAPAGLKERVLESARLSRAQNRAMTPLLWKCVAGCVLLLAIVLGLDAYFVGKQTKHLQSYLDGRQLLQDAQDTNWPELAKDLDESPDSRLMVQVKWQLAEQRKVKDHAEQSSYGELSPEVY